MYIHKPIPKAFTYRGKTYTERFWEKVDRKSSDKCWLWTGCIDGGGYGRITIQQQCLMAHRVCWVVHYGKPSKGLLVLHKCDVRRCVNPRHLFLGTHKDNLSDAISKGRWKPRNGEDIGTSKLTAEKVIELRKLFKGGARRNTLSKRFHITEEMIGNIVYGKAWKHLPGALPTGSLKANYKLDHDAAKRIRDLFKKGQTQAQIAPQFGVCKATISVVVNNQCWT